MNRAIRLFLDSEGGLLRDDVSELTIVHKFATILGREFPSRNVDVNYNRHGQDIKFVRLPPPCRNWQNPRRRVLPDVVVHQRGNDSRNLLVIEIKKSTNSEPRECDIAKLRCFREQLHYRFGLFLEFQTRVQMPAVSRAEWQGEF